MIEEEDIESCPGDGVTEDCEDEMGCGFWKEQEEDINNCPFCHSPWCIYAQAGHDCPVKEKLEKDLWELQQKERNKNLS